MILSIDYVVNIYTRKSKFGKKHEYSRKKAIITFRCDSCGNKFKRDRGAMDPNRLNDNYYHVCNECNVKKFAQQKSVESKRLWDMPVSSLKKIGNL